MAYSQTSFRDWWLWRVLFWLWAVLMILGVAGVASVMVEDFRSGLLANFDLSTPAGQREALLSAGRFCAVIATIGAVFSQRIYALGLILFAACVLILLGQAHFAQYADQEINFQIGVGLVALAIVLITWFLISLRRWALKLHRLSHHTSETVMR